MEFPWPLIEISSFIFDGCGYFVEKTQYREEDHWQSLAAPVYISAFPICVSP